MKEQFLQINGLKVFTRIAGKGKPFLILHGWGAGQSSWNKVQDILAEHFQVIALDLPGFGKSQNTPKGWYLQDYINFLLDFLNYLKVEQFYLLGHSFGGRIAIKLSVQFSKKIEKMILVDAAGIKGRRDFIINSAQKIRHFSFLPGYNFLRKIFYKFIFRNTEYLAEQGSKKETHQKVVAEDLAPFLEKITIPTLIVWGKKDKITPLKGARLMKEKIKNSSFELLPCRHSPHREAPEELVQKILQFLR
jgi:pimeloyl-ACP methyl ester carboxylesterase